jgi:hypothetical protein
MSLGSGMVGFIGLVSCIGLMSLVIDFWIDAPERNFTTKSKALVSTKSSAIDKAYEDDELILNNYEEIDDI